MKALILAAGLGTRLKPLTNDTPKALVPVGGRPMISHLLDRLASQGVTEFIVNLHHHGDQLREYLEGTQLPGVTMHFSDERDALLDTGGALKRAAHHFDDDRPFLVHNVDVHTTLDVNVLLARHLESDALATLAVRSRETARRLIFDEELRLCGWMNSQTGETMIRRNPVGTLNYLAFSGIQVISPDLFRFFPPVDRFSLVEFYLGSLPEAKIIGFRHDDDPWADLGTPDRIHRISGNPRES